MVTTLYQRNSLGHENQISFQIISIIILTRFQKREIGTVSGQWKNITKQSKESKNKITKNKQANEQNSKKQQQQQPHTHKVKQIQQIDYNIRTLSKH